MSGRFSTWFRIRDRFFFSSAQEERVVSIFLEPYQQRQTYNFVSMIIFFVCPRRKESCSYFRRIRQLSHGISFFRTRLYAPRCFLLQPPPTGSAHVGACVDGASEQALWLLSLSFPHSFCFCSALACFFFSLLISSWPWRRLEVINRYVLPCLIAKKAA